MATINNRVLGTISDEDCERPSAFDTKDNSRNPTQEPTANARSQDIVGKLPVDSTASWQILLRTMEKEY